MEINLLKIGDVRELNKHPDCPNQTNKREGRRVFDFDEICKFCSQNVKLPKDRRRCFVN